jgi:hypothetical protein
MSGLTIELVQFRLVPGTEPAAFLAAAAQTRPAITKLPGFIKRELLHNDDGLWFDLVHWRSKAEALAAADVFGTLPEVGAFASMIDMTQMKLYHLEYGADLS